MTSHRHLPALTRFWLGTALAALTCAFAAASPTAAMERPFSLEERRQIIDVLQPEPDAGQASLADLSDQDLKAMVLREAAVEAGQHVSRRQVDRLWGFQPASRDIPGEFEAARAKARLGPWLQTLGPPGQAYQDLRAAQRRYARLVALGGWPALPEGPVLRDGDADRLVSALRRRLRAEGYEITAEGDRFDADLTSALKTYQVRHGLTPDGVLGPRTRASLDVSAPARLAQIEANLERARWLPRPLAPERLEVDVASATATLFEADAPVLSMRVVVGDLRHKTPIFASRLEAVVVNPPWNVPASIATNEILPRAARDPSYLARNGFRIVEGRLQQRPGPANALGRLKFDLQSPYGVYLHDTPAKNAFARETRTLSHGCMRLENPAALAQWLLARQGWPASRLESAIADGETRRIALERPLSLLVVYWTAFVNDGGLHLLPDPYRWDAPLARALAGAAPAETAARGASDCAEQLER